VFVRIDIATQRWRSVQSTFGVSRLVLNGSDPAPLAQQVISGLKAREDSSGYVQLDQRPKFALGAKVRVLAGVFAENLGLFDGTADRDRVAILLDLLGRKVRVSIEAELVAAA
jgi:transcriptional antiterminator RfaH